jgi:hypothetical protein
MPLPELLSLAALPWSRRRHPLDTSELRNVTGAAKLATPALVRAKGRLSDGITVTQRLTSRGVRGSFAGVQKRKFMALAC